MQHSANWRMGSVSTDAQSDHCHSYCTQLTLGVSAEISTILILLPCLKVSYFLKFEIIKKNTKDSVVGWMKNIPHRFWPLNTWFPIIDFIWDGLRYVALLENISLAFLYIQCFLSLLRAYSSVCEISTFCSGHHSLPPTDMSFLPLLFLTFCTISPNKCSSVSCLDHSVLSKL